jgi:hypothetical protein
MSFDTKNEPLVNLLRDVHEGKMQLPEFQRDYVWDEEDVCSLLESVVKGFPVGALLTLECGGQVNFKRRPIEGAPDTGADPEYFLLDGQQRMTSLYNTIFSEKPARVRNGRTKKIEERLFYLAIDMALAAPSNIGAAIEMVSADKIRLSNFGRKVDLDLSTVELEYEHMMFPFNKALFSSDWVIECVDHWIVKGERKNSHLKRFNAEVLGRIKSYAMPVIKLGKDNSREAVCTVFEKVNVGGKKLDAFELVTAIYAGSGFDLRGDWSGNPKDAQKTGRLARLKGATLSPQGVFMDLASTDFLQACTLLHTIEVRERAIAAGATGKAVPGVSCDREALLRLPVEAYQKHAPRVEKGFIEASKFLTHQGIFLRRDLPYPPQMVALAAFFALDPGYRVNAQMKDRLAQWYWSGVLGEFYGSATETKIARDVPDLGTWLLENGVTPQTTIATSFQAQRLDSLRSRTSAAYKGFGALLMGKGCRDLISGSRVEITKVFAEPLDIHHIFPQAWCKKNGIDKGTYNSIINKTPLTASTNREIGGRAPSEYLARIERRYSISPEKLDEFLRSHLIDPAHLRTDDFQGFWAARKAALVDLAAEAQGKPVLLDEDPEQNLSAEGDAEIPDDEDDTETDQDDDEDTSASAGEDA